MSAMQRLTTRTLLLLLCVVSSTMLHAQSLSVDEIKQSDEYYWGEGFGDTEDDARRDALEKLTASISSTVEARFENIEKEVYIDGELSSEAACQKIVKTYSQATLQHMHEIFIDVKCSKYHLFCYVAKSDVEAQYEARKQMALDELKSAVEAKDGYRIDDALRCYYYAYCLLRTVPNPGTVKDEDGRVPYSYITEHMRKLFKGVEFYNVGEELTSENGKKIKRVKLKVLYEMNPVKSFEFAYSADGGQRWSSLQTAKDGSGEAVIADDVNPDDLLFRCEYIFEDEWHYNKEISQVMGAVKKIDLNKHARLRIKAKPLKEHEVKAIPSIYTETTASADGEVPTGNENEVLWLPEEDDAAYRTTMEAVIAAIRSGVYEAADTCFTNEGCEMYHQLIKYGKASIFDLIPEYRFMMRASGEVVCRSIRMKFQFKNNHKSFIEDVTFTFNQDGKIDCLAFALDERSTVDIMKHDTWSKEARMVLAEFLENYKTAYALKRLDYIRSIFDDNAYIVVGRKIDTSVRSGDGRQHMSLENYERVRVTKDQYLRNLERCFASNEYVNIRFADNDITHTNNKRDGETYGIQIKQDYYSTNYGDTGYLFLMVDLNEPKKPRIMVRTWQQERDPRLAGDGLWDMSDF